jgi:biotin transport system substrate-specific component
MDGSNQMSGLREMPAGARTRAYGSRVFGFLRAGLSLRATARPLAAVAGVVVFAALTAVSAQVAIPLAHTPVPITLQTLVVVLAGITLGPRLGTTSMAFYLLLGMAGYHVFALQRWGLDTILGATGGYLLGFLLAQPAVGWLARPQRRAWWRVPAAAAVGNAVIFVSGLLWLKLWLGVEAWRALELGFWPFLPGTALKGALTIALGYALLPLRRRWFERG